MHPTSSNRTHEMQNSRTEHVCSVRNWDTSGIALKYWVGYSSYTSLGGAEPFGNKFSAAESSWANSISINIEKYQFLARMAGFGETNRYFPDDAEIMDPM